MPEMVERESLDLRYEAYRMRNPRVEEKILCALRSGSVEEPLLGVDCAGRRILLDGFKRVRCAALLRIHMLPYTALGEDRAQGILSLLRGPGMRGLTILEQARFVEELSGMHGLSAAEIATQLSRSKAWVCLRQGLIAETPPAVLAKLMASEFSTYAYLYIVRPFMRINGRRRGVAEDFIKAVSGKGLSVREIRFLFQGYHSGSDDFREQVRLGRLQVLLRARLSAEGYSTAERQWLEALEAVGRQLRAALGAGPPPTDFSPAFAAEAGLLSEWVFKLGSAFLALTRRVYAESQRTVGHLPVAPGGDGGTRDRAADEGQPEHGPEGDRRAGAAADRPSPPEAAARGGTAPKTVRGMPGLCAARLGTLDPGAPGPD
jgi:hypothetical protein